MTVVVVVGLVVLLVVAVLVGPLRVVALDREATRRHGAGPLPDATVEEVAAVAGGTRRVAETALARLVEGDVLAVAPDRTLHATGRAPHGELDRAVLDAVATWPSPTAAGAVGRVRHGRVVAAVVDGARHRGLLHDAPTLARVRRDALLVLGAVVLVDLVAAAILLGPGGSVLGSVTLLAVPVGVAAVFATAGTYRRTPRGRATLAAATRPTPYGQVPDPRAGVIASRASTRGPLLAVGAAGLVAVGGLARFPDPGLARLLLPPPSSGGGFGGGFGGGDGGGGCGGGDGGGGGGAC